MALRFYKSSLFVGLAYVGLSCAQNDTRPVPTCVLEAGGYRYDFLGYENESPWRRTFGDNDVVINFCTNEPSSCDEPASIIRVDSNGNCMGTLAFWENHDDGVVSYIDETKPDLGLQVVFTNGKVDSCPENETVTMTFFLQCGDERQSVDMPTFIYEEIAPNPSERLCDFRIAFLAPEACFRSSQPVPVPDESSGLSGGWVFTIIVIVFFFVYFVGGMLFNRLLSGAKGSESIPNVSFWRSLPALVSDGCNFTQSLICGGGRSSISANDDYREVGQPMSYGAQDSTGASNMSTSGGQYSNQSPNSNANNAL